MKFTLTNKLRRCPGIQSRDPGQSAFPIASAAPSLARRTRRYPPPGCSARKQSDGAAWCWHRTAQICPPDALPEPGRRRWGYAGFIHGGTWGARIATVQTAIDLTRGRVNRIPLQIIQNGITLRCAAQATFAEGSYSLWPVFEQGDNLD